MSGFLTRRLQLAGAKALGKGVRGAFGKVKKGIATAKAKKAASKRVPADLKEFLSKQPVTANASKLKPKSKVRKALEVFPFVGAKTPKKVPLKNTKPTTIRGVNIKTKAGKEFGDKVKNQPKRIAGQDPVGRKPRKMKDGGGLKDIPEDNKGLPKLPTEVRNKMGFKKDGGLVSATAKLKAQGLKDGGAVRGKARGMGAATKGGGYNV
jgi:hypothetical protein